MKTSGYALWTAALVLALAAGGGLGMSRKAQAQNYGHVVNIPSTCIPVLGYPGSPGRNGPGILTVPIDDPETQAFILGCSGHKVHAQVSQVNVTAKGCWPGNPNFLSMNQLISDWQWVVPPDPMSDWTWTYTPLGECVDFSGAAALQLAIASSWFGGQVHALSGTITLTCCASCAAPAGD